MSKLLMLSAAAMLVCGSALAQPASPVPGSQPGTKAPGSELPKQTPGATGSGSAPIGPPASSPSTTPSTPGQPSVPGTPSAPNATKKLDTPSAGGRQVNACRCRTLSGPTPLCPRCCVMVSDPEV